MDRLQGVHLTGTDGKTYFIPAKALKAFEEPAGAGGELAEDGCQARGPRRESSEGRQGQKEHGRDVRH